MLVNKKDVDYVTGQHTIIFRLEYDYDLKKQNAIFKINKDGEAKDFSAERYLQLTLEWHYLEAEKTKRFSKKLRCIINAESKIRRLIIEYGLRKLGYDFSEIFEDVDVTRRRISVYHDALEAKKSFWRGVLATVIGAIISTVISTLLVYLKLIPQEPPTNNTKFQTIQIIHDTIRTSPIHDAVYKR